MIHKGLFSWFFYMLMGFSVPTENASFQTIRKDNVEFRFHVDQTSCSVLTPLFPLQETHSHKYYYDNVNR